MTEFVKKCDHFLMGEEGGLRRGPGSTAVNVACWAKLKGPGNSKLEYARDLRDVGFFERLIAILRKEAKKEVYTKSCKRRGEKKKQRGRRGGSGRKKKLFIPFFT